MALREETRQKDHYDAIAAGYEAHYGDRYSLAYRARFINDPLLRGIDLRGKRVLEAMCGSGQTTEFLRSRGAVVTGLDISQSMIDSFAQTHSDCDAVCGSIFDTGFDEGSFDAVVVVGGLHHLHPHMDDAIVEIHRILRKGGHFCFMEPHAGSLPDAARRAWYRRDPLFESNEEAVDLDHIEAAHRDRFEVVARRFVGNLAYLFVLNSMVFRVPLGLKRYYAPAFMMAERALAKLQTKRLSCIAVCQLRKR